MKKEKFNIEFVFDNASKKNLWSYLTTATGLAEWFADDVIVSGNTYEFIWNKYLLEAERLSIMPDAAVRFRWIGEEDPEAYFELKLHTNELTGALMLEIIDFAEPAEKKDVASLWEAQVKKLKRKLGM